MVDMESSLNKTELAITPDDTETTPATTRIFMSQIPTFMRENELRSMLEEFGAITELKLLREKRTGESRGCCFVTYAEVRSAHAALVALNEKRVLPTMCRPVEMKAVTLNDENDGENVVNERKLFVGMISRKMDENTLRAMFSSYGNIENCTILREPNGRSKGCAFVTYESKYAALNAIQHMHRSQIMDNCTNPINVRFADTYQS
jgi:RNA recognition motif-containing protein